MDGQLSPIQVLEAIVDEVEGLRRTDPRSHLPERLLRLAREAVTPAELAHGAGAILRDADDLQGHTIAHVFDGNTQRGDMVIVSTDGSFLVLEAENDGDEAVINVLGRYGPLTLADFVAPRELLKAGLVPKHEADRLIAEKARKDAEQAAKRLERAQAEVEVAKRELARVEALNQKVTP